CAGGGGGGVGGREGRDVHRDELVRPGVAVRVGLRSAGPHEVEGARVDLPAIDRLEAPAVRARLRRRVGEGEPAAGLGEERGGGGARVAVAREGKDGRGARRARGLPEAPPQGPRGPGGEGSPSAGGGGRG